MQRIIEKDVVRVHRYEWDLDGVLLWTIRYTSLYYRLYVYRSIFQECGKQPRWEELEKDYLICYELRKEKDSYGEMVVAVGRARKGREGRGYTGCSEH